MINNPWMTVAGCALLGWIAVEVFAIFGRARVPVGLNVLGAACGGLLAAGFVL